VLDQCDLERGSAAGLETLGLRPSFSSAKLEDDGVVAVPVATARVDDATCCASARMDAAPQYATIITVRAKRVADARMGRSIARAYVAAKEKADRSPALGSGQIMYALQLNLVRLTRPDGGSSLKLP